MEFPVDPAPTGKNRIVLLINDAIDYQTGDYFFDEDEKIQSMWQRGVEARDVGLWLRQPAVVVGLSTLASIDLFLAMLTPPGIIQVDWLQGDVPQAAFYVSIAIWLCFCSVCAVKLKYMWGQKKNWFTSGEEPWFLAVQALVLYVFFPICIIMWFSNPDSDIKQWDGSTISCPYGAQAFLFGWCRAWTFVYFNQGVRDSVVTLITVLMRLGPFAALTSSCFFGHYFIFQAFAYGSNINVSDFGYGGNIGNAIYNLFGLMTTVNHPDVMMGLMDVNWVTMAVIMSFMFFTLILAQNLLLGFVYGEYCEILDTKLKYKAKLRSAMLDTAFDMVIANRGDDGAHEYLTGDELLFLLRQCDDEETPLDNPDADRLKMIIDLIDNKATSREEAEKNAQLQDGRICRSDMHELQVFYNCCYQLKQLTKTQYRYDLRLDQLEQQLEIAPHGDAIDAINEEMATMKDETPREWAATSKTMYNISNKPFRYNFGQSDPYSEKSLVCRLHVAWFLFYLFYCIMDSDNINYTSELQRLNFISCIVQTVFVFIQFTGDMRRWEHFHYFNPNNANNLQNATSVGLLICLWVGYFASCSTGGCFGEVVRTDLSGATIFFDAAGKVFLVMNFAVMTPAVLRLLKVVIKTMQSIGPHLGLFVAVYFGFAGMGIAFFCGLNTQATSEGGPGDWCGGVDPAGGTPCGASKANPEYTWGDASYTGGAYYKSFLNFNGFLQSFFSLYVIMIQNNWSTVVNGAVEVTSNHYRYFFLAFNVMISFVMINILVGAIVDALTNLNDAQHAEDAGEKDALEAICEARLNCTKGPSGHYYGRSWQMAPLPLHCGVRFDAAECALFGASPETAAAIEHNTELEKDIKELEQAISDKKASKRAPVRRAAPAGKSPRSSKPRTPRMPPPPGGAIAFETKKNQEKAARDSGMSPPSMGSPTGTMTI